MHLFLQLFVYFPSGCSCFCRLFHFQCNFSFIPVPFQSDFLPHKENRSHVILAHTIRSNTTHNLPPGNIAVYACTGASTLPSKTSLLGCGKYRHNMRSNETGNSKYIPKFHTVSCTLSNALCKSMSIVAAHGFSGSASASSGSNSNIASHILHSTVPPSLTSGSVSFVAQLVCATCCGWPIVDHLHNMQEIRKLLTCVVAKVEQKPWMERVSSHTYILSPCTSCPKCHCSFLSPLFTLCSLHCACIFSQIFDYLHTSSPKVLAFNHPDLLFCIVFDLFHVLLISIAALLSACAATFLIQSSQVAYTSNSTFHNHPDCHRFKDAFSYLFNSSRITLLSSD